MGSGKSAACNFFFGKKVFESKISFSGVTMDTDFHVQMIGGKLTKFVDTVGLLDSDCKTEPEFERLSKAILAVPNGIHAFGVVIKIGDRINAVEEQILEQLLHIIELLPYTFVIFSNVYALGSHVEQQEGFEILLNESPPVLPKLLEIINHRYIILESVLNKEQDYYDTKVDELMKIVQSILAENKEPFTCFLNNMTRQLLRSNKSQKEIIDALKADLKKIQDQAEDEKKKLQGRLLWKTVAMFIGTAAGAVAGATIGTALGPVGSAAGSTAGASLGGSAVAAILGTVGSFVGAGAGYGAEAKINECRTQ